MPSCEGELQKDPFDVRMCSEETWEEDKSDMSQSDCVKNDVWLSTRESVQDYSKLLEVEVVNLREDAEEQRITPNSIECLTDKDGYCDPMLWSSFMENMMEGTTEEQTVGPGSYEEVLLNDCRLLNLSCDCCARASSLIVISSSSFLHHYPFDAVI